MIEKSVLEISEILNDSSIIPVILDVREKWEYDICHIENSVHIPMGQITERKDDLNNNFLVFNSLSMTLRKTKINKNRDCLNKCL